MTDDIARRRELNVAKKRAELDRRIIARAAHLDVRSRVRSDDVEQDTPRPLGPIPSSEGPGS